MIEYLAGALDHKTPTEAVVECGGVGYALQISLNTFAELPDRGAVRLLVHPHYGENVQRLYGFTQAAERELFRLLQAVRGVGPALALSLLSHEPPGELIKRLQGGDVIGLTRVKGVGRKTAERLIVELKDRLPALAADERRPAPSQERLLEQALGSLGMAPAEAAERARTVLREHPAENRVEELLRLALRRSAAER